MSLSCFKLKYIISVTFNYCMLSLPRHSILNFHKELGLSLKSSLKVASFLRPTPL